MTVSRWLLAALIVWGLLGTGVALAFGSVIRMRSRNERPYTAPADLTVGPGPRPRAGDIDVVPARPARLQPRRTRTSVTPTRVPNPRRWT